MIAKEGPKIIFGFLIVALLATICIFIFPSVATKIIAPVYYLALFFLTWFYLDFETKVNDGDTLVVSPTDGRVVAYDKFEGKYVGDAKVITIFKSVFDFQVNRIPDDSEIVDVKYIHGKFMSAYNPATSFDNECRRINILGKIGRRYGVIQIAGMLANRIVPYLRKGDFGKKGDRIGLIKFGPKVDVIMPADIAVQARLNQKLKAGKTVIGICK